MTQDSVVILGVGDVGPLHEPMSRYSELVQPSLAQSDIRFAQIERVYSDRGSLQLHSGGAHSRVKPELASVFSDCGFNVGSLASNHAMDWGPDALLDTIDVLRGRGMQVIGAGRNLAEARAPAIIEKKCVRVAFLAYCSILHEGYHAGPDKPGIAPLRVHTYYQAFDYQAGVPPKVITVPYEEDLAAIIEDIGNAKKNADVVVLSLHWGIHFIPRMIADYQPAVARAAFEAGADLILGHHAHTPKAIGVHGEGVLLQPQQLHHVIDRQDAGEGEGVRRAVQRDPRPRLSAPLVRLGRKAQPDRQGDGDALGRRQGVLSAGDHRSRAAAGSTAPERPALRRVAALHVVGVGRLRRRAEARRRRSAGYAVGVTRPSFRGDPGVQP